MRIVVSSIEYAQRIEHGVAPVATRAGAELRQGAQDAVRFQFNLLLLRTAGRIMLGILKLALPFVVFQMVRSFLIATRRGGFAGAVQAR